MSAAAPEMSIGMTMLSEMLMPAFAGIATGLAVGFLTAYFQAKSFKRDWQRDREDMIASHAIRLIHEMATDLVRAAHAMWWLSWRAEHAAGAVGRDQINDFEMEIRSLLPKIHGAQAALRASHPAAAKRLARIIILLDKLDLAFANHCIAFRAGERDPLKLALRPAAKFKRVLPRLIKGCAEEVARNPGGPIARKRSGKADG